MNSWAGWKIRCHRTLQSSEASIALLLLQRRRRHLPLGEDLLHLAVLVHRGDRLLDAALRRGVVLANRDAHQDRVDRRAAESERLVLLDVVRDDGRVAEVRVDAAGLERGRRIRVLRERRNLDRLLALALELLARLVAA